MLLDICINAPLSAETNQQSEDLQSVERLQGKFDRTAINFNSSKGLSKITLWAKFKLKPNLFTKEIPSEGDAAHKKNDFLCLNLSSGIYLVSFCAGLKMLAFKMKL